MSLIPVESSMIDGVAYDEATQQLTVRFISSGNLYCYSDVPKEVYDGLIEAESKGRYMRNEIIDCYPYTQLSRSRYRRH